jgi:hypothetical protein
VKVDDHQVEALLVSGMFGLGDAARRGELKLSVG